MAALRPVDIYFCCFAILFATQVSFAQDAPPVDFAKEIQPLIARKCLHCHGPGHQEGGLRLDNGETAFGKLESGELGIVPGKPDESELIKRITSDDESIRMPPKAKPLTPNEVNSLKNWIQQGGEFKSHWAFEKPLPQVVPPVKNQAWVKNPIDAFILAKLEAKGLAPVRPADRRALIRRLSFDLTGLPPTPAEVEAFVQDEAPNAYETLVDRLLDSPRYGERWARHWLDVVRFAETNSFERDGAKPHAWRYRDYVIQSLNADKPYDQFLKEQIAGDEMPNAGPDAIVATGFYRLGLWDDEPADRLQAKFDGMDDLVTTAGQAFLAMTINCARCHDHKIDPITQKDYYSFVSFFLNINPMSNGGPGVERPLFDGPAGKEKYDQAVAELRALRDEAQGQVTAIEQEFRKKYETLTRAKTAALSDLDELEYRFYRDAFRKLPDFEQIKAETIDELPSNYFDISPATRESDFGFVFAGVLKVPADGEYEFVIDSDDGTRLVIDGKEVLLYDGVHGEGMPQRAKVKLAQGRRAIRLEYFQGIGGKGLHVHWSGPGFANRPLSAPEAGEQKQDFNKLIREKGPEVLGRERFKDFKAAVDRLEKLRQDKPPVEYALAVTETGPQAPDTFILLRGSPHAPGAKVEPAFPTVLGAAEPKIAPPPGIPSSGRRTALANWIGSEDNRLTSRVMVNRMWQHHFGRGIVRSPNNFGLLGDPPTHRELLDWLAGEFIRLDWKMKPLHKLIVMSNAYQMSSEAEPTALAKDPSNDLFWRFNMRRLSAEELRDSIHAVNGSLNLKMFGPGIYPEISQEVLAGQSVPGQGWGKSSQEEQSRRSVYIHVKRSLVTPVLAVFDFPDSDISCEARFNTVQPGQSLALLNGDFANTQAEVLAARAKKEGGKDVRDHVKFVLEQALSRPATASEIDRGLRLMELLKSNHKQTEAEAFKHFCLAVFNLNEFIYLD